MAFAGRVLNPNPTQSLNLNPSYPIIETVEVLPGGITKLLLELGVSQRGGCSAAQYRWANGCGRGVLVATVGTTLGQQQFLAWVVGEGDAALALQ